jgi:hypothetical protein
MHLPWMQMLLAWDQITLSCREYFNRSKLSGCPNLCCVQYHVLKMYYQLRTMKSSKRVVLSSETLIALYSYLLSLCDVNSYNWPGLPVMQICIVRLLTNNYWYRKIHQMSQTSSSLMDMSGKKIWRIRLKRRWLYTGQLCKFKERLTAKPTIARRPTWSSCNLPNPKKVPGPPSP